MEKRMEDKMKSDVFEKAVETNAENKPSIWPQVTFSNSCTL